MLIRLSILDVNKLSDLAAAFLSACMAKNGKEIKFNTSNYIKFNSNQYLKYEIKITTKSNLKAEDC
jgi:hypothetical protein